MGDGVGWRSLTATAMKKHRLALLEEVLAKHGKSGTALFSKAAVNDLSGSERAKICEFLAAELIANGIEENGEPNERGLVIESAIDAANCLNLRRT